MKPLIIFAILFSVHAFADTINIIKDGVEYSCEPTNSDPATAADCVNKAYAGSFSKAESLRLCAGATGIGPAECAQRAYASAFSRDESLRLCERTGTLATAQCAIKAYAGAYSREEAIQLCHRNPVLMLRTLNILEKSRDAQFLIQNYKRFQLPLELEN